MGGAHRSGQEQMLTAVQEALESGEHLLVQAGTGTGKSLAYLIPLITHAMNADRPAVVATATLALQAQVVKRDLPRLLDSLEGKLDRPVDVALLKGRGNYVCQHKVGGGFPSDDQAPLFDDSDHGLGVPDPGASAGSGAGASGAGVSPGGPGGYVPRTDLGLEIVRLREWAEETDTGDRDDLTPGVSDRAWRQVSVTALECLGQKCPMISSCFSEKAKLRAQSADVVVTNHALLALAAFGNPGVLPEFDTVVVDEAHELRERVTSATSASISAATVRQTDTIVRRNCSVAIVGFAAAAAGLEDALRELDDGLLPTGPTDDVVQALTVVMSTCREALTAVQDTDGEASEGGKQVAKSQLVQMIEVCERLITGADSREEVVWVNRPLPPGTYSTGGVDKNIPATLWVAPLSVAMNLRDGLFADRTVLLTSATLSIGDTFGPVAADLGLAGAAAPEWTGVDVGSPFDYGKQGMLYVAKHLASPGRGVSPEQIEELGALIKASRGGALALFSSRRAAEDAAAALRGKVGVEILCQGESSMSALVKQFSEEEDTCLFGTMTLWQGVDVPGPACRLVVIDRIPFPRPDDPLGIARSRAVQRSGGNGFMAVSATHAAVRLAQGAGRLIRAMADRGVVAVLDSRLATARYSGFLVKALPPFWRTTDRAVVLSALERLAPDSRETKK
ncbi:ATP-dependent DNA helicase [Haematomicrobium sanguinis]|uniref:ATP-dependent DNA helicase n=1 Tax=Haematomicrobium sanguinis TaxID=479106 RepID=UPI001F0B36EF|nr:ATP-dependent DNA helicase [Haematomicrobium sanguinis]